MDFNFFSIRLKLLFLLSFEELYPMIQFMILKVNYFSFSFRFEFYFIAKTKKMFCGVELNKVYTIIFFLPLNFLAKVIVTMQVTSSSVTSINWNVDIPSEVQNTGIFNVSHVFLFTS